VSWKCFLGKVYQGSESVRVRNSQLCEHTTVNLDLSSLQALDQTVVGHAVGAGCSVDALDPQAAEVALALTAVVEAVNERVEQLLLGLTVQARTLTAVTLCAFQNDATLLVGVYCPLHTCHVCTPSSQFPSARDCAGWVKSMGGGVLLPRIAKGGA